MKAQLCLLGGVPFYCHEGTNWKDPQVHLPRARIDVQGMKVCESWKRQISALAKRGYFKNRGAVKRNYAQLGLGALAMVTVGATEVERKFCMKTLRGCVEALIKERDKLLLLALMFEALFLTGSYGE
jgi:hypothetical protein